MNKQQYLAELQRLLVFMTETDREYTIRHYTDLFDSAGPEMERELIDLLGSPTKAAISLGRGYEAGKVAASLPKVELARPQQDPGPAPAPQEEAAEDHPIIELPDFELPQIDLDILTDTKEERPAEKASAEDEPVQGRSGRHRAEPVPSRRRGPDRPIPQEDLEDVPEMFSPEAMEGKSRNLRPETPKAKVDDPRARTRPKGSAVPLGVGIPLFVIVMVGLGIPLAVLWLAVIAVLLLPGCGIIIGAFLAAIGGSWAVSFLADTLMMFGVAFLLLAIGLVILWAGIWVDVKWGKLYVAGVRWLGRQLLEGRVTEDA